MALTHCHHGSHDDFIFQRRRPQPHHLPIRLHRVARAARQARGDGLIPANFKWPARIDDAGWHADGFDFLLRRCRPDGLMGPMGRWMKCDYWVMRRSVPRHPDDIWRIHEPYRDLGDILFQATRPGEAVQIILSKVNADERIEEFQALLVPEPMKAKRGAKVQ